MTTITTVQTGSTLGQTSSGQLRLETVTIVVNFTEMVNYFGGQVVLTADEDAISFTSTTEEFSSLAIEKAKSLIASAKVAEPEQLPEDNIETKETEEPTEPTEKNSVTTDVVTKEKAEETAK